MSECVSSLPADPNSETDFFTLDLDAESFTHVSKDLALRCRSARVLFHLLKKEIRVELGGVEESIVDVDFGQRVRLILRLD